MRTLEVTSGIGTVYLERLSDHKNLCVGCRGLST